MASYVGDAGIILTKNYEFELFMFRLISLRLVTQVKGYLENHRDL